MKFLPQLLTILVTGFRPECPAGIALLVRQIIKLLNLLFCHAILFGNSRVRKRSQSRAAQIDSSQFALLKIGQDVQRCFFHFRRLRFNGRRHLSTNRRLFVAIFGFADAFQEGIKELLAGASILEQLLHLSRFIALQTDFRPHSVFAQQVGLGTQPLSHRVSGLQVDCENHQQNSKK
ncbi:MAG: hypothetical protein R3C59_19710 [Planctomycetaceae bacterium]